MAKNTKEPLPNFQLTVGELVSELLMTINICNEKILVVEGMTDKRFWNILQKRYHIGLEVRVANKKECNSNKEYVIKVIEAVNKNADPKIQIYGIVDYDYDWILKTSVVEERLFYYKYHDLEVNLILSWGFEMVNQIISSESKKIDSNSLRNILFNWTYDVGILRLINKEWRLGYKFTNIDWKRLSQLYVSGQAFDALQVIMNKVQIPIGERERITKRMVELKSRKYPVEFICSGHDMVRLLSALTIDFIATERANRYDEEHLAELLALAYNIEPAELNHNTSEYGLVELICDNSVKMKDIIS